MSNYTKGPWSIEAEMVNMPVVKFGTDSIEVVEYADACLIAAAPEMLEALERLVADEECPSHIANYLLPVIARARGDVGGTK